MLDKGKLILASSSPRRAQLLNSLGVDFSIEPSHVLERPHADESPADYIIRTARAKAVEVARKHDGGLILGADTEVIVDGVILGKPSDEEDAKRMLRILSGRWHAVMTGIALFDAGSKHEAADYEKTLVRFARLNESEIDWYVNTREPFDKAGGYAIQGLAALFIEEVSGNYHNVVGLPIPLLSRLVKQLGFSLL